MKEEQDVQETKSNSIREAKGMNFFLKKKRKDSQQDTLSPRQYSPRKIPNSFAYFSTKRGISHLVSTHIRRHIAQYDICSATRQKRREVRDCRGLQEIELKRAHPWYVFHWQEVERQDCTAAGWLFLFAQQVRCVELF